MKNDLKFLGIVVVLLILIGIQRNRQKDVQSVETSMIDYSSQDNDEPFITVMLFSFVSDTGAEDFIELVSQYTDNNNLKTKTLSDSSFIDSDDKYHERNYVFDTTNGLSLTITRQQKIQGLTSTIAVGRDEVLTYHFISPSENFVNYIKQGKVIEGMVYSIKE